MEESKAMVINCLKQFDTEQEKVSEVLFNVYPDEMLALTRLVKKCNLPQVSGALPEDATVKLLQTIIGWEKDISEYMSLETKLRELFIISERQ